MRETTTMPANVKTRLDAEGDLSSFCRARQGRQRLVAMLSGMTEVKLSLALRGRRWVTGDELKAITRAVADVRSAERSAKTKGKEIHAKNRRRRDR